MPSYRCRNDCPPSTEANVTIRNIDDDVIVGLKAQAKANHRSLEGEIRHLLSEQVLRHGRLATFRERAAQLRAGTDGTVQSDSVRLIREDRDR